MDAPDELRAVADPGMLPTPPTSEDDLLAAYYHEQYPGLKMDLFDFLRNVSQMDSLQQESSLNIRVNSNQKQLCIPDKNYLLIYAQEDIQWSLLRF